jgi:hypothetical protein
MGRSTCRGMYQPVSSSHQDTLLTCECPLSRDLLEAAFKPHVDLIASKAAEIVAAQKTKVSVVILTGGYKN